MRLANLMLIAAGATGLLAWRSRRAWLDGAPARQRQTAERLTVRPSMP